MLGPDLELNLTIPKQTLSSLSFAEHTPAGIATWTSNLPMANVGETARQLYQGIIETNQLAISPAIRSQILETFRDPIYFISGELSKHFLNQAVSLPEKQQKIANLVQALHVHLATGYKIVMMESLQNIASEKVRKNFACASHRMISEFGNVIVRANQLYSGSPKGIWRELHQVYRFSEGIGLLKYTVTDKQNKHQQDTRIDHSYKRCLLLSCARPNQLRQNEISAAYGAFELWADHVEIGEAYSSNSVFVVDLDKDAPPKYKSLMHDELNEQYYGFDTAELVQRLTDLLSTRHHKGDDGITHLVVPQGVTDSMLNHINHSLGILTKRTFKRIANSGSLHLCAGLSASHYYTADGQSFQSMLMQSNAAMMGADNNQFMKKSRQSDDAWNDAHDAGGGSNLATPAGVPLEFDSGSKSSGEPEFPEYSVPLVNTSPGGYCLQWSNEVPANIQAGEILAVRESKTQPWSIAVIRWIRHARKQGTQLGIELLAPHAQPCAVQLLHRTGAPSEYLRGLLLPELSSIGQPSTLVTPRVPFQPGNKVSIRYSDNESKCILETPISSTASFNQFKLSPAVALNTLTTTLEGDSGGDDDFDSLWPSL